MQNNDGIKRSTVRCTGLRCNPFGHFHPFYWWESTVSNMLINNNALWWQIANDICCKFWQQICLCAQIGAISVWHMNDAASWQIDLPLVTSNQCKSWFDTNFEYIWHRLPHLFAICHQYEPTMWHTVQWFTRVDLSRLCTLKHHPSVCSIRPSTLQSPQIWW